MKTEPCYFCNSEDTKYCGVCGKWLCEGHRKNYPKRLMAFIKEQMSK